MSANTACIASLRRRRLVAAAAALLPLAAGSAGAADLCRDRTVPAAARELGMTRAVIDVCPKPSDISFDGVGLSRLYNGHWWDNHRSPPSTYTAAADGLAMALGGALTTISPKDGRGALPTLPGARGFYVEFDAYITGIDRDHWPALWLMPIEHNARQEDRNPDDPPGFERWMELDVDEGGFAYGVWGTTLNWKGIWPKYERSGPPFQELGPKLDRTLPHTFAAAFEPDPLRVTWWLDGQRIKTAGPPYVPEIARRHHYYLLMTVQTHGKNVPYQMVVRRFRAFVPPK